MATFKRGTTSGEHVIIVLKTTDSNGVYKTATVTTKIRISDPDGNVVVPWANMDEDSEGVHTYAYDPNTDASNGTYTAALETVNTDDNLKTLSEWTFDVEDL